MTERGIKIGRIAIAGIAALSSYSIIDSFQDANRSDDRVKELGQSAEELNMAALSLALSFEHDADGFPAKVIEPQPKKAIEHLQDAKVHMKVGGFETKEIDPLIAELSAGNETTVEQFAD